MGTLKGIFYSLVLLAIAAIWFSVGSNYATQSMEPEVVQVETAIEIEKEWDTTLVLGIHLDGSITEAPESEEGLLYVVTVRMNIGESLNEVTVWLSFGDDEYAGLALSLQSDDYAIDVRLVGDVEEAEVVEGDEF